MPDVPKGPQYDVADPKMRFRVWQDGRVPGSVSLETLRQLSVAAEGALSADLASETQARKDADTALGGRIDTEASARASADTAEANARQSADTQEAQARASADTAEATARANGDAGLQSQITQEIADRKAADSAEAKARGDADTAETTARTSADTNLQSQITAEVNARTAAVSAEAKSRADADTAEINARTAAVSAEATARSNADAGLQAQILQEVTDRKSAVTAEATARANADTALQTQIDALKAVVVPLLGTLTLPAGLTILVGKSTRTVAVTGLKRNDNIVVTPNAALPANLSMGEAYCLTDGTLTVVLVNSATLGLSITTAQTIPLGIIALRP